MPRNRNQIWTADDDKRLLELKQSGRSFMSIAAALKRSQSAIAGRFYVLRKREMKAPLSGLQTISTDKWTLKIYDNEQASSLTIATHEFNSLASLRITIVENPGLTFVVHAPELATAADRNTLLDLRAQGFTILMTQ